MIDKSQLFCFSSISVHFIQRRAVVAIPYYIIEPHRTKLYGVSSTKSTEKLAHLIFSS